MNLAAFDVVMQQKALATALRLVAPGVTERSPLPILSSVLLHAEDGALHFATTNLDLYLSTSARISEGKLQGIAIPLKALQKAVAVMQPEVRIGRIGPCSIVLSDGRSEYRFKGLPYEEFPILPKRKNFDPTKGFTMDADRLRDALLDCAHVASTDAHRYGINGCFFEFVADVLTIVATDGTRLAIKELPREEGDAGRPRNFTLPNPAVRELLGILRGGPVKALVSCDQAMFTCNGVTLVSRTIDGSFPNYRDVVPKNNSLAVAFDREAFATAIARLSTISSSEKTALEIRLSPGEARLYLNQDAIGEAWHDMPAEYSGPPQRLYLNAQRVGTVAKRMAGEVVTLRLPEAPGSAVIIDASFTLVMMPMRPPGF